MSAACGPCRRPLPTAGLVGQQSHSMGGHGRRVPLDADVIVVGAGAVGTSTALHLARCGHRVIVLEKEPGPARHQSGRNSGVIHAGYNLKPGSLKARFCVEGNRHMKAFCHEQEVAVHEGGILVVASHDAERSTLKELHQRAVANGVQTRLLDHEEIPSLEPHATGVAALHAPEGASVDAVGYVEALARCAVAEGATLRYQERVKTIREDPGDVVVQTSRGILRARGVVNCAGLHADRLAGTLAPDMRVIPFRGYYAELRPPRAHLVQSHVYGVPDLDFPFLGVHLSRRTDGRIIVGPGAMLAFGRESYRFWGVHPRDLASTMTWPGFWRLLGQPRFRSLVRSEIHKSLRLKAIWREARQLVPELVPRDLVRSFAGNRAQLVHKDGSLVEDVVVRESGRGIHVLNAVSPGLTSSLPFGNHLAQLALARFLET